MAAKGLKPNALHNNCSGKHSGFICLACGLDEDPTGYIRPDHRVQREIRAAGEEITGFNVLDEYTGTDGCSIPTWAAPLDAFALGFARMATGEGLPADIAGAARRIFDAATSHPFLVGGSNNLDSDAMAAFGGRLMLKGGAEGVFCGAIRDRGWGFALKIDDGNAQASKALVAALLLELATPDAAQSALLEQYASQTISNVRKREVGTLSARLDLVRAAVV